MPDSESEIIERATRGDRLAQAEIVQKHERMVYNLALKLVGNPDDAENVLQETFLKVLEALPSFRGGSTLSTWIYRIATNYALMHLRNKKRTFVPIDDLVAANSDSHEHLSKTEPSDPLKEVLNSELREHLKQAIDELPPKFKAVFILKDVEGFSLNEISTDLAMSLPAVKSNLHRARLFLRNRLFDYFHKN